MVNKGNVKRFYEEVQNALNEIGEKYGVELRPGSCSYGEHGGSFSVKFTNIGEDGVKLANPRHEFYGYLAMKGKMRDGVKKLIGSNAKLYNGKVVSIVDYDTKKRNYPVIYTLNGATYKTSVESVIEVF